ncbi:MAG: phytochelatin synthase family protein [Verrucomicrobia bacterium]|nr:phytochelatin synthase family protein [Verrucomicrobiota bacterium]
MKTKIIILLSIFTTAFANWEAWDSPEGISRFQNSNSKENFWKLVRYYESQATPTYCSVASSVIALNALSVEAPKSKTFGNYRMFTQAEFFSDEVNEIIQQSEVARRGMSLNELSSVLKSFPVQVKSYEALDYSEDEIRQILISALRNPNQSVLAVYQRKELNQVGGGHWSPVAAYDEGTDSLLILDVAKFKYPPVWIDASAFIHSMQTTSINGYSRGLIILEKEIIN